MVKCYLVRKNLAPMVAYITEASAKEDIVDRLQQLDWLTNKLNFTTKPQADSPNMYEILEVDLKEAFDGHS